MPSTLSWVDFTEKDRQKMMEIIKMGRDRDTRDELGLGSIRDSISDIFFPGTSTIQTRLKYMLFVPWIYLQHERNRTPHNEIKAKARQSEFRLISALKKNEDWDGLIGKEAGASLQRLPSNIYWAGLYRWGIRLFPGSQEQYHRYLREYYAALRRQKNANEEEPAAQVQPNWHPAIPEPPDNFPGEASFVLRKEEAEYLQDRISIQCRGSLLAYLINHTEEADCTFVWEHPGLADLPAPFPEQIKHAENFSRIMHGALLLYNLMLSEASGNEEYVDYYQEWFRDWQQEIWACFTDYEEWSLSRFWEFCASQGDAIPDPTRTFVKEWVNQVRQKINHDLAGDPELRNLIYRREVKEVKLERARLLNQRGLDMWTGASGTARLDFRWRVVNGMVNDMVRGLSQPGENHVKSR